MSTEVELYNICCSEPLIFKKNLDSYTLKESLCKSRSYRLKLKAKAIPRKTFAVN